MTGSIAVQEDVDERVPLLKAYSHRAPPGMPIVHELLNIKKKTQRTDPCSSDRLELPVLDFVHHVLEAARIELWAGIRMGWLHVGERTSSSHLNC